jgi:hypothetical protein
MNITRLLLFVFLCIFQFSFSQNTDWTAIDKSYSFKSLKEGSRENMKDSDEVKIELYSFPELVLDNIDLQKEKSAMQKEILFKEINDKIAIKGNLSFKKNSVYLIRLQQGVHSESFRLDIKNEADKKIVDDLEKYLNGKVIHGNINKETVYTSENNTSITSFIINITDEDHFDFKMLKEKFDDNIIVDITKVPVTIGTIFIKLTT